MPMKNRFRLIYCVDSETGKRSSLNTKDRDAAKQIVDAKNQALRQPTLNRQIVKACRSGADAKMSARTWHYALEAMVERKHGPTRDRWERAIRNRTLDLIRHLVIVEAQPGQLWSPLEAVTVSTIWHPQHTVIKVADDSRVPIALITSLTTVNPMSALPPGNAANQPAKLQPAAPALGAPPRDAR